MTQPMLLQIFNHPRDGVLLVRQSVKEAGVDHLAVARICALLYVSALDDLDDIYAECMREVPVSLVMRGHRHDRARTVAHHDIVCDEYRNLLARDRIDRRDALQPQACLVLYELRALKLCLLGALLAICHDRVHIRDLGRVLVYDRMLRRHDHECHAVERVGAGSIYLDLIRLTRDAKVYKGTRGLAYPVDLLLLDRLRIVHIVQPFKQPVCVLRDLQIPDILGELHDITMADIAFASLRVLVGEDDLAVRAVVDQRLVSEYQSVLKEL